MTRHLQNLAILILLAGYVVACAHNFKAPPSQPPAEKQIPIAPAAKETKGKTEAIAPPLQAATQRAERLTPANVETEKPGLADELRKAWAATLAAINSAKALEAKAEGLDKANAEAFKREQAKDRALEKAAETIEQQNGVISDLNEKVRRIANSKALLALSIGLGFCVLLSAGGGLVAYSGQVKLGIGMMLGGGAGIAFAILGMTMQNFAYRHEEELGYGVCALAVIGLGIGGYLAYRRLHESTVAAAKLVQTGIVTGAVDFERLAPIARTVETPLLAKLVNKHTSKEDRAAALAAADVNGPGNVQMGGA